MSNLHNVSYSLLQSFKSCRRFSYFRYIKGLVDAENNKSAALSFGTIIHECLDAWHAYNSWENVEKTLKSFYPNREIDQIEKESFWHAYFMLRGYIKKYANEEFEVISLEQDFTSDIVDTDTMQPIPGVQMVGKIDGIIKIGNENFLLEHKTASKVDANYLSKLWFDTQIILYCHYASKVYNVKCSGILYNILGKQKIVQDMGETEKEYEKRCEIAKAKNKSGITRTKRKLPESDSDFFDKLEAAYCDTEYHREKIYPPDKLVKRELAELSEVTKAYISAIQRDKFYMNKDHCFRWGAPCPYFAICVNNDNQNIIDNLYEVRQRTPLQLLEPYGTEVI